MIQAGKYITQRDDQLVKVQLDYLFHSVKNPKPQIASLLSQLRTVMQVAPDRYRELKKNLPYVVCGIFNPPIRRTENFAWINHFILDIDHLSEKEVTPSALKERLKSDHRIKLMFISPSNDGLKVFFELREKCSDPVKYSYFYRVFVEAFSRQYHLDQVIDRRTSDVTRACFISHDTDAFYNPQAEPIEMSTFINFENYEEVKAVKEIFRDDKQETSIPLQEENKEKQALSEEKLMLIRKIINPNVRVKTPKNIMVPEEIEVALKKIVERFRELDISIEETKDIHYGKQLRFVVDDIWSELNVFYGKKGYTVVVTSKTGANKDLGQLAQQAVCEILIPQHG